MTVAERITDPVVFHGEGPFWDEQGDRLLFVDMLAGAIMSRDVSGAIARHPVPSSVAAVVRRRRGGGFVVAVEHGFVFADESLAHFETLPVVITEDGIRFNDGGCDPLGRMYCGTMAYDVAPGAGALYRMDANRSVRTVLADVTISNGMQWSADGRRAFYIDTPTDRVDVFDVAEDGELSNRRPFVTIEDTPGHPDGMAIDDEDGIWVALWEGGAVRHFDAAGRLVEQIEVPGAAHVTACAFGGPERSTLFITTSRDGVLDGEEPGAGSLYAVETRSRGARLPAYAG